jgi:hypothetical protein
MIKIDKNIVITDSDTLYQKAMEFDQAYNTDLTQEFSG